MAEDTTTTTTVDDNTDTTPLEAPVTGTPDVDQSDISNADDNQSHFKPEAHTLDDDDKTVVTAGASVTTVGDDLASDVVSPTTNDTEQSEDDRLEQARATAMHNHSVEHADDPIPTSGDKTRV